MAGNLRANRNEIIRVASVVWAGAPTFFAKPKLPPLVIAAADGDGNPDDNQTKDPWARIRVQHTASFPTSIKGTLYRNEGGFIINVFVFRDKTNAWTKAEEFAEVLANAYRAANGKGNVTYTGVTVRERPINNGFSQVDVVGGFYWLQRIGA